jgi:hypothetical protein
VNRNPIIHLIIRNHGQVRNLKLLNIKAKEPIITGLVRVSLQILRKHLVRITEAIQLLHQTTITETIRHLPVLKKEIILLLQEVKIKPIVHLQTTTIHHLHRAVPITLLLLPVHLPTQVQGPVAIAEVLAVQEDDNYIMHKIGKYIMKFLISK